MGILNPSFCDMSRSVDPTLGIGGIILEKLIQSVYFALICIHEGGLNTSRSRPKKLQHQTIMLVHNLNLDPMSCD